MIIINVLSIVNDIVNNELFKYIFNVCILIRCIVL